MDHLENPITLITIHYFRYDGSYNGWYVWVWPEGQPGSLFEFMERDSYGVSCHIDCQKLSQRTRIGLVIKKSRDRWDQGREDVRFLDLRSFTPSEFWLVENDPAVYFEPPEIKIRFIAAF
ncbi:MAG: pullulanase-associated domain-containing protein, partial [bacterium]